MKYKTSVNISGKKPSMCLRAVENGHTFVFAEAVIPTLFMKIQGPPLKPPTSPVHDFGYAVNLHSGEANKFQNDALVTPMVTTIDTEYEK